MLIRLLIFTFINLVCIQGICQTFRVCNVSGNPASVTYTNGKQVAANDLLPDNKILKFQKFAKIALIDQKSKEMFFFSGEGQFVVADIVKANKSKVKSNFKAYVKDLLQNKVPFRRAGVIYKNGADSILCWGAEHVSLCDNNGNIVKDIEDKGIYYFVVSNPADSAMFVNVVAQYANGTEELRCKSDDAASIMDLIVPPGAQVVLSAFPQVFNGNKPSGFRVVACRKPVDPQLALEKKMPLTIVSPAENSNVNYPQVMLRYMVEDIGNVSTVEVQVNGVKVHENLPVVSGIMECMLNLDVYGKNIVQVTAVGKAGERYGHQFALYHQRAYKPKLHLLAVGIGNYKNRKLEKLHFAANDAAMVHNLIDTLQKRNSHLYSQEGYRMLVRDKEATRGTILKCLDDIRYAADPEDIVMVYISGHGKFVEFSSKRYFLPYDAEEEPYLESTAISYSELKEKLKLLEDKECKVIIYLDACYAGEMYFAKAANDFIADADPAVIGFYSSTRKQPSLEKKSLGHGVFTYALLNGLNGGAKDNNGNITISSLGTYIAEQVRIESEGRQTPKVDNGGEDFILFRADNMPINIPGHTAPANKPLHNSGNAAASDDIIALAESYYTGKAIPPTLEHEFEAYAAAAKEGNPKFMYMLGVCYETGKGCNTDIEQAIQWYNSSAQYGIPAAQYNLGAIYYNGKAGKKDLSLARKWFADAANKDYTQAQAALGYLYMHLSTPDYDNAFIWLKKAAEKENPMALYYLGECHLNGYGTPENITEALAAFKKSADLGYKRAKEKLINIY